LPIGAEAVSTNFFKELLRKLKDKEYRDLFVAEQIYSRLPLKMQMLREQRELTQKQFGEKAGMAQAWVSKIEDPNYGKLTISTLLKVASAHDVALIVDFVPFSKLLRDTINLSPKSFEVSSFDKDQFEDAEVIATTEHSTPQVTAQGSATSTLGEAKGTDVGESALGTSLSQTVSKILRGVETGATLNIGQSA
jgi:transcriptional regulator with XRE-family HTH domain